MKYSIVTFGCRVNQADALGIEGDLRERGCEAASIEEADAVFVNTCSVTAAADQAARQTIRRIARANPRARIVVTGCYATRRPDEVASLPSVARVIPNADKDQLVALTAHEIGLTTADRFGGGDGACGAPLEPGIAGRTAFTLRVQTGCDEPCAYCIIPSTRGSGRSLSIDAVVKEVETAAEAGFKEIVLTGVHLGSYGRDLQPPADLVSLLRRLDRTESDVTFRISSLEPMDCTVGIVDLVASSDRFAPHFHLPLQHGSDAVLRRMRRPYTLSAYRQLVDRIRERLPHASIGSDVIVGFPGERDEEFEATAAYLSRSPLTHLHVFPYSDRPGTAAAVMPAKVPGALVRQRAERIRTIGRALAIAFRDSQVGATRPGLTLEDGTLVVTDNYLKVRIAPGRRRNMRVTVRIDAAGEALEGTLVTVEGVPPSAARAPSEALPR
jgi:threonylcarbamoyladenosine tRNA methylthiotransferase MtaB